MQIGLFKSIIKSSQLIPKRYSSSSSFFANFLHNVKSQATIMSPAQHNHDHDDGHSVTVAKGQVSPFALTKDSNLKDYLHNNKLWIEKTNKEKPTLFELNGKGQAPHTLWIGCSDSRYNENCLNVSPGEIFAFKSIANLVSIDDLTTLSTLEFSINCLKIKKIVVCGHTECGGILNSLAFNDLGSDNSHLAKYLTKLDELRDQHLEELKTIENISVRAKKLAEYNVKRQLEILNSQEVVIRAVKNENLEVWGLIYNVDSGLLEVVEA